MEHENDTFPAYDLVVSIINYRTADLTLACVESVIADFEDIPTMRAHVVVVDNASGDGSDNEISSWIASRPLTPPVTLIRSTTNGGFSAGHNQGITTKKSQFYIVLNSDAVLKSGFFRSMLTAATANPDAGLLAPRIDYEDGSQQVSCFRMHSPLSELIRAAVTGFVTSAFKRYDVPLEMPPVTDQIGWVSFAGVMMRASMINEIGLMDEGYFLYFEDTEYCMRAQRGGWKIAYVPEAKFVHFRGGSAPVKSLEKARKRLPAYYYASRTRLFYQTYGYTGLIGANLMWCLGRGIANLRLVMGKSARKTVAQEWRDIWTNILTPLGDNYGPKK